MLVQIATSRPKGEAFSDLRSANLLSHEVGREDGSVFHELVFHGELFLQIYCETFNVSERMKEE